MSLIQYTPIVGPLTTDQPLETRGGWQRQQPDPVRRRGIVTALTVAACVLPATFAQGHAAAPTDWRPNAPSRIEPARRAVALTLAASVLPSTSAEGSAAAPTGWRPSAPDRVVRAMPQRATYVPGQPMFGVEVDVPVMSWTGWFPDVVPGRRPIVARTTFTQPLYLADVTVTAPALSWKPSYPENIRIHVRKRAQVAPQPSAPIYVPDVTVTAPARSWAPTFPDAISRRRFHAAQQQAFARDRFDAPGAVVVPDLSWAPEYPDRIVRAQAHAARVPSIWWDTVEAPTPALTTGWDPILSRPALAPRRPAGCVVDPIILSPSQEQWTPIAPDWIPVRQRRPFGVDGVAPIYVADVTEAAPSRSWAPFYVDMVWPAQRLWWHLVIEQNIEPLEATFHEVVRPLRVPARVVLLVRGRS